MCTTHLKLFGTLEAVDRSVPMRVAVHPVVGEVMAGYIAGSAKTLMMYPLDTLTTWRELGAGKSHRSVMEYYAGCSVTLLGTLPYAVLFHTAFYACESALLPYVVVSEVLRKLLAGTFGAIAATLVGVPFECLKHRMQLGGTGYTTPLLALKSAVNAGGVRALYTGIGSTLARNIPYNALHFGLFELLVGILRRMASQSNAMWCDLIAGAFAGSFTAVLTTPMDVVNTRLQTQAIFGSSSLTNLTAATAYVGPIDAAVQIARQGGLHALMQGADVRCVLYAPSAIVFFAVYENIKRHLRL